MRPIRTGIAGIVGAGSAITLYAALLHPIIQRLGATEDELSATWPGDELVDHIEQRCTRAITIEAPVHDVWPWIRQIGQDRGGFYSYRCLENLIGADMPKIERVVRDMPERVVGETVWLATPKHNVGSLGRVVVARIEPERCMILVMPDDAQRLASGQPIAGGTWGFILEPRGENQTRLILRSVSASRPMFAQRIASAVLFDFGHFVMEWRMMNRIKELSERLVVNKKP